MGHLVYQRSLALLVALVASCAGPEVPKDEVEIVSVHGRAAPLRSPSTFFFAARSTVALRDPRFDTFAIESALRSAIERRLGARGVLRAAGGAADYELFYRITAEEGVLLADLIATAGRSGSASKDAASLPLGSLVLALTDAATREVVWHGAIEGGIDPDRPAEQREARVELAVERLMARL